MQLRHEHDERACKYMIRMGLLGASRVSRYAVIEPAAIIEGLWVSAVAARDAVRAASFAETNGIPRVQADYNALLASDTVDLVYIGLPPSGHARSPPEIAGKANTRNRGQKRRFPLGSG